MAKEIITIHWENQHSKHQIELDDNYYSGYCLTHSEFVNRNIRCSHFPCQTAMWADLWNIELKNIQE